MIVLICLVTLPELRTSDQAVDRKRPLPTSLQSDFLPDDVLLAITQPPASKDKLGPPSRTRNLNTTTVCSFRNFALV